MFDMACHEDLFELCVFLLTLASPHLMLAPDLPQDRLAVL